MAKEEKKQDKKPTKTPEQIEAEKAAKVAKKAEMAAKAKEAVSGGGDAKAADEAPKGEEKAAKGGKGGKGAAAGGGRKRDEGGEALPFPQGYVPRLKQRYSSEIAPALMRDLKIENKHAVPRVDKVVISIDIAAIKQA